MLTKSVKKNVVINGVLVSLGKVFIKLRWPDDKFSHDCISIYPYILKWKAYSSKAIIGEKPQVCPLKETKC